MKLRNIFPAFAVLCIIFVGSLLLINRWVSAETSNQIYRDISQIPSRSVGLVLGTSKYIAKTLNPYYEYRIKAALELYKQDKINVFLLSGESSNSLYHHCCCIYPTEIELLLDHIHHNRSLPLPASSNA
ncbi:vancomycin high temperature exclusion protein [Photobacterium damselae subsp. piscicida]|nr:vancomycin high temperature exclusion protein [Photobacterium damselae subsp. piscicida]